MGIILDSRKLILGGESLYGLSALVKGGSVFMNLLILADTRLGVGNPQLGMEALGDLT